jgi:hypothetical protein
VHPKPNEGEKTLMSIELLKPANPFSIAGTLLTVTQEILQ